jgi:hypothetical protein
MGTRLPTLLRGALSLLINTDSYADNRKRERHMGSARRDDFLHVSLAGSGAGPGLVSSVLVCAGQSLSTFRDV